MNTAEKLEDRVNIIKYLLLFFNGFEMILAICIMSLSLWLRFDQGINEWLTKLNATSFYSGIYVLIVGAIVVGVVAVLGCIVTVAENKMLLMACMVLQVLGFIFGLAGAAVLLDNSARDSRFQPVVRESMRGLIMNGHYEPARQTLQMIQETIGCCGADGARDYVNLHQPLPNECRDTVTGNPFFHGCVDELTWFFEEKCGWIAGLVMITCFMSIINIAMSVLFIQGINKGDKLLNY